MKIGTIELGERPVFLAPTRLQAQHFSIIT